MWSLERDDLVLGEIAFLHLDLAAPADAAPAADALDIDAERRAASSTGVPTGKRPRLPDGMKRTSGSWSGVFMATVRLDSDSACDCQLPDPSAASIVSPAATA